MVQQSQLHLIRFFECYLRLYRNLHCADNSVMPDTLVECDRNVPAAPLPFGGLMTKMALFLFGFLVLTIGIGLLATISPV